MKPNDLLDKIAITLKAHKIMRTLLDENSKLKEILNESESAAEARNKIRNWMLTELEKNAAAVKFYNENKHNPELYNQLEWKDFAAIRLLDYIEHAGKKYADQNIHGEIAVSNPVKMLWLAVNYRNSGASSDFFADMLQLFRQLNGEKRLEKPSKKQVINWMNNFRSGLDPDVIEFRIQNKKRIIDTLIKKIDGGKFSGSVYFFEKDDTLKQKEARMYDWWKERKFHLHFAVRSPDLLNEMLDFSLDNETMNTLFEGSDKGIPFFVNPYYLSLLNVQTPEFAVGSDLAIRCYIIYSKQLVEEFGEIEAWEKEDKVRPEKPNAAGWILPSHNIHRRYPEVAIFIPDTAGRACGGLCASCQRMYDFQTGRYNFNLEKLKPAESWKERLPKLLDYFKDDTQLRDILVTGGDALMSSNKNLKIILNEIYKMAVRKKNENRLRCDEEKYAEIVRVRIGTRLPVYLPQRITPELAEILESFKTKAVKIGIKQFIIQTHFESPMEVTPEAKKAIGLLLKSGWNVTNQQVFTVAASRRGHTAKLRKVLNDIGVLTYYTLTVKGFKENSSNFVPNARAVQEQIEEKIIGQIPEKDFETAKFLMENPESVKGKINFLRDKNEIPFLATDRNIINLPGVGKSMTFRTIGITRYGRRILEFEYDQTRNHSPAINRLGKVIIIESKSIGEYLRQLDEMGEDPVEYNGIYGFSIGQTEMRLPIYEYPEYKYKVTEEFSNLALNY